jgi:hypothetical protein
MKFLVVIKGVGKCVVDDEMNTILYPSGERKVIPQWDISIYKQRNMHQGMRGLV